LPGPDAILVAVRPDMPGARTRNDTDFKIEILRLGLAAQRQQLLEVGVKGSRRPLGLRRLPGNVKVPSYRYGAILARDRAKSTAFSRRKPA